MKTERSYLPARNSSASQEWGKALAYSSGFPEHLFELGVIERAVDRVGSIFVGGGVAGWAKGGGCEGARGGGGKGSRD